MHTDPNSEKQTEFTDSVKTLRCKSNRLTLLLPSDSNTKEATNWLQTKQHEGAA